jgi:ribosomal protein S1
MAPIGNNAFKLETMSSLELSSLTKQGLLLPLSLLLLTTLLITSKSIRLSLRPHVVEYRAPRHLPELGLLSFFLITFLTSPSYEGEVLTNYTVTTVIKKYGVLFTSKTGGDEADEVEEAGAPNKSSGDETHQKKNKKKLAQAQRDLDESSVSGVIVHRSSLEGTVNWETIYSKGKQFDVRVLGYHLVEGIAVGSNTESFLEGEVVHQSQVSVGQILEVEIQKVANFGVIVLLGGKVRGLCPMMHLLESSGGTVTQIQKKFKIKQKLTMRVWEANGPSIIMTNKKSLVQAEEKLVLKSLKEAQEGQIVLGVVSEISQNGLQVHFFNKVKGMLPMSVLVKQGVTDIEQSYRLGQVIKCVILQKKPKLLLGLDIGDTENLLGSGPTHKQKKDEEEKEEEEETKGHNDEVKAENSSSPTNPSLVPSIGGTVIKHEGEMIHVRLDDGRLGLLTRDQLCDFFAFSEAIAKTEALMTGKRIEHLIVINASAEQEKNNTVNLSIKPLFLSLTAKSPSSHFACRPNDVAGIPSRVTDLSPGQIIYGTVWKVESYGILVRFRDGMSALAPRPNVADKFIASPVGMFTVGDAIRCVVQRVDLSRDRAIINLKPVLVPSSSGETTYLASYLHESFLTSSPSTQPNWRKYSIGTTTRCTVHQVKDYGVILMASDHVTLMLAKTNQSVQVSEGEVLDALVLDVDTNGRVLEVTIDQSVVQAIKSALGGGDMKVNKKKKAAVTDSNSLLKSLEKIAPGDVFRSATILLVKEKYLITLVQDSILCYVMIADYHCPYKETANYATGDHIPIRIEKVLRSLISPEQVLTPYDQVTIASVYDEESDRHRTKVSEFDPSLPPSLSSSSLVCSCSKRSGDFRCQAPGETSLH